MVWRSAATVLAALLFASAARGQKPGISHPVPDAARSPLPPVVPSNRPAVGLALEGGGALGLVHIGVLQWLEEHHVPVDRLSGTSMGALIGGLYATGTSPADLRALAVSSSISRVFTVETPYADASYRRREDRREIPQIISIGLKDRYGLRNALLTDRGVNEFLSREFFAYNGQQLDYDQLPIPFRCVATDLNTLHAVSFANGPLPQAVRASISIPGVFPPVQGRDGHYLVDGGILDDLPTGVLRDELHADAVIAVRLADGPLQGVDTGSIVAVLNRAFAAGIAHNAEQSEALADVVVHVKVSGFSTTDFSKAPQLIDAGYKAAEQNRAALLRYALDDPGWLAYLKARDARRLPSPGVVRQVRVEGGEPGAVREVRRDMKPAEGQPASSQAILSGLKGVQADGVYGATYEMLAQPADATGDAGILVHLRKDPKGPPYLLVGPELAASTSNISQGELDLRLIAQNLGGYGSELRAGARIGYLTDLSAEYYRLLSPSGYFVQPEARILREPVYIWANQKRIADRFEQNLEAGLEAGRTVNNHLQIAARWSALDTRWSLRTGTDGGPYLSGTAQTGLLRVNLDESTNGAISPSGFRLSAAAGALYHAVGSDNAPLVRFSFTQTHPWRQNNIFGIGAELNSYLRARVAEPYRFTLGGPMRLSASSFDEYRGTDTYLVRTGYMHRIAAMPAALGQGLYGILGYEAGEIWSPDAKAILRQDGTTGLVAATPLGVITFGVSVGDAGRRKVFFTIGRWF
jgi:NTE family protein